MTDGQLGRLTIGSRVRRRGDGATGIVYGLWWSGPLVRNFLRAAIHMETGEGEIRLHSSDEIMDNFDTVGLAAFNLICPQCGHHITRWSTDHNIEIANAVWLLRCPRCVYSFPAGAFGWPVTEPIPDMPPGVRGTLTSVRREPPNHPCWLYLDINGGAGRTGGQTFVLTRPDILKFERLGDQTRLALAVGKRVWITQHTFNSKHYTIVIPRAEQGVMICEDDEEESDALVDA